MLNDHWDKYKFHPGLVESGLKGLPKLEAGKFYTIPLSSYDRYSQTLGSGWKVWECAGKPTVHSEYAISYPMLTIGPHDGSVIETFIYGWFGKGDNIILELPEAQQAVMRQLKASVKDFSHIHLPSDHTLEGYRV
jgi:hypothetical protein